MKINWGTGIVIGMGIFMIFILQYVIRVQVNPELDNELVTEAYYQQEVAIDGNYKKTQNAQKLGTSFSIEKMSDGILITFPEDFDIQQIKGNISLYRPSNQKLDKTIPIRLSTHHLLIPKNELVDGRWDISVDWSYKTTSYLLKKSVHIM